MGRASRPRRRVRGRAAHAGRGARRPRRRLPPELARRASSAFLASASIGAVWSSCSPDFGARSVVDRFAQIEPKVLLCRRRLPLRRPRLRPHGRRRRPRGSRCRHSSTPSSSRYLDPEADPERLAHGIRWLAVEERGAGAAARLRARPLRPPALGPLLLGHDGPAEGDRPGPRRDPARAPEEAQPAPRRPARRPRLLVHDDRLDDVELPRRRPPHRRLDRPLRRQPRAPRHGGSLGARRRQRHDLLRYVARATSPPA